MLLLRRLWIKLQTRGGKRPFHAHSSSKLPRPPDSWLVQVQYTRNLKFRQLVKAIHFCVLFLLVRTVRIKVLDKSLAQFTNKHGRGRM
jgi:hypothetical protein